MPIALFFTLVDFAAAAVRLLCLQSTTRIDVRPRGDDGEEEGEKEEEEEEEESHLDKANKSGLSLLSSSGGIILEG